VTHDVLQTKPGQIDFQTFKIFADNLPIAKITLPNIFESSPGKTGWNDQRN
jgi:hypothetical protein